MQFLPPFASAQTISTIYDFEEMLLDILGAQVIIADLVFDTASLF